MLPQHIFIKTSKWMGTGCLRQHAKHASTIHPLLSACYFHCDLCNFCHVQLQHVNCIFCVLSPIIINAAAFEKCTLTSPSHL
uniref:Uncharacterized protein n=1 Tax=Anguilla anguilla TaxID=7936 RepID=A0A0E9UT99_ANGAN